MAGNSVTRTARAKINLTLHVTGQRDDGYHLLDSLVCFAACGDELRFELADKLRLNVDGPMAAGVPLDDSNLVLRAARLLDPERGAHIQLSKHLPTAAGIGGGSADAAATLLGLSELWGLELPDRGFEQLGADVPVCLSPLALRMRGIGERLSPVAPLPQLWAVLVNPRVCVATPQVFAGLARKDNSAMPDVPDFANAADLAMWCAAQRNDLEPCALKIAPVIGDVLNALTGALLARMSGSGATCFGLCASSGQADALAQRIRTDHPDWWVVSTGLS